MPSVGSERATIHYESYGDERAPAVVFAHGAGGSGLSWWQQVPSFRARHRVVTIDHRGFGRSRCEAEDFHPRHFPGDLRAVLDACGIERAALVCQSMGGWTGLPFALREPARVSALVLCDTPGGLWTDAIAEALRRTGERLRDAGVDANAALAPDFPVREPELAHLYALISSLNPLPASALRALYAEDARIEPARLAGFATPTLVVAGEHDLLFPLPVMRDVAARIPGAKLEEFAGCGHSTYFEDPERFNEVVGAFVAACSGSGQ